MNLYLATCSIAELKRTTVSASLAHWQRWLARGLIGVFLGLTLAACGDAPLEQLDNGEKVTLGDGNNTATSGISDPYEYLNVLRTNAGMVSLSTNANLSTAALNHAKYLRDNNVIAHEESSGLSGYTGMNPSDRVVYAGYSTRSVGEGIANGDTEVEAIDNLMTAIYHRFTLLSQSFDEIGMGYVVDSNSRGILVHNMGNGGVNSLCETESPVNVGSYYLNMCSPDFEISKDKVDAAFDDIASLNPEVVVWPQDGAVDIPPAFFEEIPDPLPNHSVSGNPISVQFNASRIENASVSSFRLYDEHLMTYVQNTLLMGVDNDPNLSFTSMDFVLFPLQRLEWGRQYRAELVYVQDGVAKNASWRFTTRELDAPVHRIVHTDTEVSIANNSSSYLYFVPSDGNDIISQFGSSFPANADVEMDYVDQNTIKITVAANSGDEINLVLAGSRDFTVIVE